MAKIQIGHLQALTLLDSVAQSMKASEREHGKLGPHKYIKVFGDKFIAAEGRDSDRISFETMTNMFKGVMEQKNLTLEERSTAIEAFKTITKNYKAKDVGFFARCFGAELGKYEGVRKAEALIASYSQQANKAQLKQNLKNMIPYQKKQKLQNIQNLKDYLDSSPDFPRSSVLDTLTWEHKDTIELLGMGQELNAVGKLGHKVWKNGKPVKKYSPEEASQIHDFLSELTAAIRKSEVKEKSSKEKKLTSNLVKTLNSIKRDSTHKEQKTKNPINVANLKNVLTSLKTYRKEARNMSSEDEAQINIHGDRIDRFLNWNPTKDPMTLKQREDLAFKAVKELQLYFEGKI